MCVNILPFECQEHYNSTCNRSPLGNIRRWSIWMFSPDRWGDPFKIAKKMCCHSNQFMGIKTTKPTTIKFTVDIYGQAPWTGPFCVTGEKYFIFEFLNILLHKLNSSHIFKRNFDILYTFWDIDMLVLLF